MRNGSTHHGLRLAACACSAMLVTSNAAAQLAANQTNGFGNGNLVTFTYQQNFDCVDEPTLDLDFNGIPAQSDPNEMRHRFARRSRNPAPTRPVAASNTRHTCMC
jgi:hypothetical protein